MTSRTRQLVVVAVAASLAIGATACSSDGDDREAFCTFYRDFEAGRAAAERAQGDEEANPDLQAIVDDATAVVPSEIADAWGVIADSQNDFAEAREAAGLDPDAPDEEAFESFDMSDELAAADDEVAAWVDEHCEPVNDL